MNFRTSENAGTSLVFPPHRPVKKSFIFRIQMALYRLIGVDVQEFPWIRTSAGALIGFLLHWEYRHPNLSESVSWKNWVPGMFQNLTFELFSGRPFSYAEIAGFSALCFALVADPLFRALKAGSDVKTQVHHTALLIFICLSYPNRLVWTCALLWVFATRIIATHQRNEATRLGVLDSLGFDVHSSEPRSSLNSPSRLFVAVLLCVIADASSRIFQLGSDWIAALPLTLACGLIALTGLPRKREDKSIE